MGRMKPLTISVISFLLAVMICRVVPAQTPTPPSPSGEGANSMLLEALTKKVDEQNAKIDALSQQILKLGQQLAAARPGVMIGEATPAAAPTSNAEPPKPTQAGNSHVVAKGETLTSIAKMHKVSVEELQKLNHIENDRKLQIGQTIMIPASAAAPPAPSPNE